MSNDNGGGWFGTLVVGAGLAAGLLGLFAIFRKGSKWLHKRPGVTLILSAVVFAAAAIGWPYLDALSQETLRGAMAPLKMVFRLVPTWLLWMLAASSLILLMLRMFVVVPAHTQE